jgi:predicted unusual protein kinase regulating ubiquinone biosynthesis (AarF/ABC1/UbiB family)
VGARTRSDRKRGRTALGVTAGLAVTAGVVAWLRTQRAERGAVGRSDRSARTVELAKMTSRAGAAYAGYSARAAFASDERKDELRAQFELRTAEQVADALGQMKGAVMKLGQMASYLDQGLPDPVREALAQLQSDAPPMSAELAAGVIEAELGGPPEVIFAEWDPEPLASASIGQVHRAVTHDGVAVAVKVQYPGVDEAIRSDLDNSDLLFGAMSMLFPGMDPKPIVGELRERLTEELDYLNEARNQQMFAAYYEGHPTISVPSVHARLSTARVLTTDLAEGASFAEVKAWSADERNLAAETLYRYAFGGLYRVGVFNGDPHPGNYLFRPGGHVTFLDYGLCKVFAPEEVTMFEDLIRFMVFDRDMAGFAAHAEKVGLLTDAGRFEEDALFDYFSHFYETVLDDEVRTITPEYASESVRRFFDLSGPHAEIMKAANLPPSFVIIQRINLGLFALFAELGATANWRRIAEEIWPWVNAEPSTPMGDVVAEWEAGRSHARPGLLD